MVIEPTPPGPKPRGFPAFLKGLARPVLWAWDKLDRIYSRITVVVAILGAFAAAGLLTWADVAAWLGGGWWFAVAAGAANVMVLGWMATAALRLESAERNLAGTQAMKSEPSSAGEPTALTVEAEWGGVGWKRDARTNPQPYCTKDKTPLMVAHKEEAFGVWSADSANGEAMSAESASYLVCPRCTTQYALPMNQGLGDVRPQAAAVLVGELRTQRDAYFRRS